jgi:hypothetical protein
MEEFTQFVQYELARGLRTARQKPAGDALVRMPPPKAIRLHK